jgi:hypothetical protein
MIPPDSSCRYSCAFASSFSEPLNRPICRWIFDFPEVARTVKLKSCQPRAILVERNAKHNATLFTPAIGDKLHHHQRIFLQLLANDNATAVCVYDHRLAFNPKIACRTKTRDCNRNLSREPGATPSISLVSLQCRPSASIQRAKLMSKFMLNPFLKSSHISWIRLRKRNNRRELRSRGWCLRKSLVGCCYEIRKAVHGRKPPSWWNPATGAPRIAASPAALSPLNLLKTVLLKGSPLVARHWHPACILSGGLLCPE